MKKVGVFDSGVGGKSVADAIEQSDLDVEVIFMNDAEHVPYGTKSIDQLRLLSLPIISDLATKVDVVVIACNTLSAILLPEIVRSIDVPVIGVTPMIREAVEKTATGRIIVCATPGTLASNHYRTLKSELAGNTEVFEPDCSDWAELIENNQWNRQEIDQDITPYLEKGADVIVLGCTHYHWISEEIDRLTPKHVTILQPEEDIIDELRTVLARLP